MSEIPRSKLADVAEIRTSNVDKLTKTNERRVLLCNYMDVYSNEYITRDMPFMVATADPAEIERFRVMHGDVIITKDSETPDDIGVPAVVVDEVEDLVCGYHLSLIRPDTTKIDPLYLSKAIASTAVQRYFSNRATGSTRYGLASGTVAATPIPCPPLSAQSKIGKILKILDDHIAATRTLIAKYRLLKSGLMHDLFTRGLTPDGQLRPKPEDEPELYHQDGDRFFPKDWQASSLRACCDWLSGGTPSRSNSVWWSGEFPWLTPKDMKRFELSDTSEHVTEEAARLGSRVVPEDTVFIVVRGMILAHTFPVVLSKASFSFNQDIKAMRPIDPLTSRFLAYWLVDRSQDILRMTTEATHGTKRLDLEDVYKTPIGIPSGEEQQAIVQRVDSIHYLIEESRQKLEKYELMKRGLMEDLLTGRVEVKV